MRAICTALLVGGLVGCGTTHDSKANAVSNAQAEQMAAQQFRATPPQQPPPDPSLYVRTTESEPTGRR